MRTRFSDQVGECVHCMYYQVAFTYTLVADLNKSGIEHKAQAQVRPFLRRFEDLAHDGQLDRGEKVMLGVVTVAVVSSKDLLAYLGDQAKGRVEHAVNQLRGC